MFFWKFHCNAGSRAALLRHAVFVSILVFLEVPLQPANQQQQQRFKKGFNPCFSGSSTATGITYTKITFKGLVVSILVFLEVPLQPRIFAPPFRSRQGVSILVFLEVPLQHIIIRSTLSSIGLGFNPCFSGSSTATIIGTRLSNTVMTFQSLFFWKFHCNVYCLPDISFAINVSILVFLEVPLQRFPVVKLDDKKISFNPCFSGSSTATLF